MIVVKNKINQRLDISLFDKVVTLLPREQKEIEEAVAESSSFKELLNKKYIEIIEENP